MKESLNLRRKLRYATDPEYREKCRQRSKEYYEKVRRPNKTPEFRAKCTANTRRLRETKYLEKKFHLQKLLGGKCVRCGVTDPRLLDFDHKEPKEKRFLISQGYSKPLHILEEEAMKCQLLCPNCHRLKTLEEHSSGRTWELRELRKHLPRINRNRTNPLKPPTI